MATVNDIITIQIELDISALLQGQSQAQAAMSSAQRALEQQGTNFERSIKNVNFQIDSVFKGVAKLFGIVLTFEGFKKLIEDVAKAGSAMGRFAESIDSTVERTQLYAQAFRAIAGTDTGILATLAKMKSDLVSIKQGVMAHPPQWLNSLGQLTGKSLANMEPEQILQEAAKQLERKRISPAEARQWFPGLPLSYGDIVVLTKQKQLLEELEKQKNKLGTPTTPQVQAMERLQTDITNVRTAADLLRLNTVTMLEPFLHELLDLTLRAIKWVSGIEKAVFGTSTVEEIDTITGGGIAAKTPLSFKGSTAAPSVMPSVAPTATPSVTPSATGGPSTGTRGGANYMRGPLPTESDLITVQTAAGPMKVNRAAASDMKGFVDDLVAAGAPVEEIGAYNRRTIAGRAMWSQHAYGTAIDYGQISRNVVTRRFSEWAQNNPQALREILKKNNMLSGGDWRSPDFGHFEWRGPGGGGGGSAVRGSMFNDIRTASGRSAATTAGIALPSGGRMGDLYEVTTPDGRKFVTPLIDRGPAAWTGRGVDISAPLAEQMGYGRDFPTDSRFTVKPYVPSPQSLLRKPNVATGASAAAAAASLSRPRIIQQSSEAHVNQVIVNTHATDAAGIAHDIRNHVGRELNLVPAN